MPAQKNLPDHVREQREFLDGQLRPRLDAAAAGRRAVFFVDPAHFVRAPFLGYLWCLTRLIVRSATGRKRSNVLGASTRSLVTLATHPRRGDGGTVSELLGIRRGLSGPSPSSWTTPAISGCAGAGRAAQLDIHLLFLPPYSPNLNLIERLWRFMKRQAAYGRYHPTFADFRATIEDVLGGISTTHADKLATLMTLNFQEFEDVSLLAARSRPTTSPAPVRVRDRTWACSRPSTTLNRTTAA